MSLGYSNHARINASGVHVFGSALANPIPSLTGIVLNTTDWPCTIADFSGCPLAIIKAGVNYPSPTGALITPRHLLMASHMLLDYPVGAQIAFRDPAGNLVTRTISERNPAAIGSDIRIATLDAAATGCRVYKLPTADSVSHLAGATILCLNKDRTIKTRTVTAVTSEISHAANASGGALANGDSSQPAFLTRGGELVLLGVHRAADAFPIAALQLAAINSYCAGVSQVVDTVSIDPASWEQPLTVIDA